VLTSCIYEMRGDETAACLPIEPKRKYGAVSGAAASEAD